MPRDETRTIKVRCTTWDQVEAFYTHKLKADSLVVKMPVRPAIGEGMTVALGLPSGLVFAIDGSVVSVGPTDAAGKSPVALKMHGLTKEVRERLARLVKDGRDGLLSSQTVAVVVPDADVPLPDAPLAAGTSGPHLRARSKSVPPNPDGSEPVAHDPEPRLEDVIVDERPAFQALAAAHKRLTGLPAHEVLGVPADASLRAIRAGYFNLARTHHPDAYGKYLSPALRRLASELFIHVNRAYDRMREAELRASGVSLPGPAARGGVGWVVELGDVEDVDVGPPPAPVEIVVEEGWGPDPVTGTGGQVVPAAGAPSIASALRKSPLAPAPPTAASTAAAVAPDLASELFGDMPAADTALPFDAHVPASTQSSLNLANAGRAAMAGGRFEEARANFAAALRLDGRNRPVRALYHVASGMVLREKGQQAEATTQFETALGHDPQCADAQRALGRLNDNQGIFKRVFDR